MTYEPVLQVAEIMLTFVTVNVPPLAALELGRCSTVTMDEGDALGDAEAGTTCSTTSCPSAP